ncbi:sensor histidine kinase [Streptomyces sp. HUAS ZL42]|uniref:sensor histidine kinase n=1 Tax=Streptomyces sp. HUAS ZL42 TaxID=3231715 RepID=UPI00345EB609
MAPALKVIQNQRSAVVETGRIWRGCGWAGGGLPGVERTGDHERRSEDARGPPKPATEPLSASLEASDSDRAMLINPDDKPDGVFPIRSVLLDVFAPRAAAVLAFLLVFGLVGGWLLAGRMLAPLTHITHATRMATNGSLSHRIRLPGRKDEFRELADTFDTMLVRLEAHVAEQRRFAANASHELRTPLAISKSLLDVARTDPNRDTGELIDRLHAVNTRAIDLTEALLLLSRAEQRSFTRESVDLSLLAEEATETLLPLAEKHGVAIETVGDVAPTRGSQALLLQLTMNLVHNAIVHNLPEQGTVWITTRVRPMTAVLTVENTGEQVTPQLTSTLTEPFQRGTERTHTDHAGVGLGLAMVKTITHAHDGTLTVTPRSVGGIRITVELPATSPHTDS